MLDRNNLILKLNKQEDEARAVYARWIKKREEIRITKRKIIVSLADQFCPREQEVLDILCENPKIGYKEIGWKMNISSRTVKYWMARIFRKMEVQNRYELFL